MISNLYSKDIDEIAEVCIDMYLSPEKYQEDKNHIINRLLELPDKTISYDFSKSSSFGEAHYLVNFSLMALISLYTFHGKNEILSSSQILSYSLLDFYDSHFNDLFKVPEFKKRFLNFLIKELSNDYSEKNFYYVTWYLYKQRKSKDKDIMEILLSLIKLIENWFISSEKEYKIDNKWLPLRLLITQSIDVIKEAFTKLLIKLLKKGKYEIISFYSYVENYVKNENLKSEFKKSLPDSSKVSEMEIFFKAERAYAKQDYEKALECFEQLPKDFPQIRAILNHKLYFCAKETNEFMKLGKYLKEKLEILNERYVFDTTTINQLFDVLIKNSRNILVEKGIPCKLCYRYISPNAKFCPICGEPQNK